MTNDERMKKVDEARKKYGRPFIHERQMKKPTQTNRVYALAPSKFQHQKRPLNV